MLPGRRWPLVCLLSFAWLGSVGCAGNSRSTDAADSKREVVRTLRGYATYYGPGFEGERTASGRRFNSKEMVAAHRTLPFGTRVRVTNLENGRSVILRVVDRGPYARRGTIIDVSQGAARRLGFVKDGRVRVRVDVLRDASRRGGQPGPTYNPGDG